MNNIIFEEDYMIGTKENIWKFFKWEINNDLQDNTIDFEVLKTNINDMLDVMEKIQDNVDIYSNTLIKVKENAMGGYTYKILEEVD